MEKLVLPFIPRAKRCAKKCGYSDKGDAVPPNGKELIEYHKYIGETIMFRTLALICSVTIFVPPDSMQWAIDGNWHRWYGLIGLVVNVSLYVWYKWKSPYRVQ